MDLLQEGIEPLTIALWLGHESVETTQIYLDANLAMKQAVLDKTTPPEIKPARYRPPKALLQFLQSLRLCEVATTRPHPRTQGRRVEP